jgi:Raf kinase inhibitor-like YbhB/YbcL family protein
MRGLLVCVLTFSLLLGAAPKFTLQSTDFVDDGDLSFSFSYDKNGCTGDNKPPKLAWSGAPAKTRSFALVVSDPDAYPVTFIHWVRVDIPSSLQALPPADDTVKNVGLDVRNSFGGTGYGGPCPPKREAPHHYVFTLYALSVDRLPGIGPNSSPDAVMKAMQGRVLGETELTGRFGRG